MILPGTGIPSPSSEEMSLLSDSDDAIIAETIAQYYECVRFKARSDATPLFPTKALCITTTHPWAPLQGQGFGAFATTHFLDEPHYRAQKLWADQNRSEAPTYNTVAYVLESVPAQLILKKNVAKQNEDLYKEAIHKKTLETLNNPQSMDSTSSTKRHAEETSDNPMVKRPKAKRLRPKDLADKPKIEQLRTLILKYGKSGVLDTRKSEIIPVRFQPLFTKLEKTFRFPLTLAVTEDEISILKKISVARSLTEIAAAVAGEIPSITTSPSHPYIKLAPTKLRCYLWQTVVQKTEHNEDWYRMPLHGDILDFLLMSNTEFETKKSNVRLGFILKSTDTEFGDLFFAEDEGKENGESTLTKEQKKLDFCRSQAVKYWRLLIPSFVPLDTIESISLHCHRLELKIMGTAILQSSETVHYEKITLTVPTTGDLGSQTARLLLGLLSLKRNILIQYQKLQYIFQILQQDTVNYLQLSPPTDKANVLYRSNSTTTSEGSTGSAGSTGSNSWQEMEQERRLHEAMEIGLREIDFGDDVLTSDNWEQFLKQAVPL
ncbi:hypothetical protein BJV82DRAFT_673795 [Fennellomyces sp. T-0311]|nr:hypothetical protein BJV82DRAFT_673795 [Fennellomyces sp. T-0311]